VIFFPEVNRLMVVFLNCSRSLLFLSLPLSLFLSLFLSLSLSLSLSTLLRWSGVLPLSLSFSLAVSLLTLDWAPVIARVWWLTCRGDELHQLVNLLVGMCQVACSNAEPAQMQNKS